MLQSTHKGIGFNTGHQFHPFKIYNVPPSFCVVDGGVGPGNSWRTFSVRDGLVSYRSKYGANGNQPIVTTGSPRTQGNFDNVFFPLGTDGIVDVEGVNNSDYQAEAYGSIPFPFPVQLDGYNETGPQGLPTQFVLTDVANSAGGWRGAGFYLKIRDNPGGNNTDVYLAARMFDDTLGPFPDPDQFTIPLGVVWATTNGLIYDPTQVGLFNITQVQYDHLTNRYPITPGPDGFGSFTNYRGNWDDDTLTGQYFWPSDLVIVSGPPIVSYLHKGASIENSPPPGANWVALS
jgi:hypothetical protein